MARTNVKSNDLTSPLYATLGATDRAVEFVRESVTDLQTRLSDLQQGIDKVERNPRELRGVIEARVSELQGRALVVPDKVQGFLEQHEVAYGQLVERGDKLVRRIRGQKSTQDAVKSARTTSSKAKTTRTQAGKASSSTASTAKSTAKSATKNVSTTAKKQSKAPQSSAKATATGARKTAKSAAKATVDAGKKVGD